MLKTAHNSSPSVSNRLQNLFISSWLKPFMQICLQVMYRDCVQTPGQTPAMRSNTGTHGEIQQAAATQADSTRLIKQTCSELLQQW